MPIEWMRRRKKAALAVAAAQAQLVACELAIATFTGPAFWTAQTLCLTKHSVALAAIYSTLEKVKKDAKEDADREDELAWTEHQLRSNLINAKCDRQEEFAALQHWGFLPTLRLSTKSAGITLHRD